MDHTQKYLDEPQLIKTVDTTLNSVWGIAILENRLFLISPISPVLHVYNAETFAKLEESSLWNHVNDLHGPRDLAADVGNKRLYIVEVYPRLRCFDADGNPLWKFDLEAEVYNLSLAKNGNLVVMFDGKLQEYNTSGEIIRDVNFISDHQECQEMVMSITDYAPDGSLTTTNIQQIEQMDFTWHALSLGSDGYLICQGWGTSEKHTVFKLDQECHLTDMYGSEQGSDMGQLSDPVYLALDRDGCVLVADSRNNRVVLLNKEKLVHLRDLLTSKDGIDSAPYSLLDNTTGRLYVGLNNGKLLIFQLYK